LRGKEARGTRDPFCLLALARSRYCIGDHALLLRFDRCDTLLMAVSGSFLTYRVPSNAMAPTLRLGEQLTVRADPNYEPAVGDIVVFHPPVGAEGATTVCGDPRQGTGSLSACSTPTPQKSDKTYIKRIVAGPNDTLAIVDGRVIRNGSLAEELYVVPGDADHDLPAGVTLPPNPACNFPTPITIPPDHYFVLGDNRAASSDSRFWGPVPRAWIIGRGSRRN